MPQGWKGLSLLSSGLVTYLLDVTPRGTLIPAPSHPQSDSPSSLHLLLLPQRPTLERAALRVLLAQTHSHLVPNQVNSVSVLSLGVLSLPLPIQTFVVSTGFWPQLLRVSLP